MNPDDDAAIRAAVRHWERAWNAGDMQEAMALFTDDADFVNVWGSHWQGLFSWVMLKDADGRWRIRAAHNTHVAKAL
jgi:ketosteroid isomerase-like protein